MHCLTTEDDERICVADKMPLQQSASNTDRFSFPSSTSLSTTTSATRGFRAMCSCSELGDAGTWKFTKLILICQMSDGVMLWLNHADYRLSRINGTIYLFYFFASCLLFGTVSNNENAYDDLSKWTVTTCYPETP